MGVCTCEWVYVDVCTRVCQMGSLSFTETKKVYFFEPANTVMTDKNK